MPATRTDWGLQPLSQGPGAAAAQNLGATSLGSGVKTAECLLAGHPEGGQPCGGRDHRPASSAPRWENGGGNTEGRDGQGRGRLLPGAAPAHGRGASATCPGLQVAPLMNEQVRTGDGQGRHRDREGCLHTSCPHFRCPESRWSRPPDTSSAQQIPRQIQRPATWSAGADAAPGPPRAQLSALTQHHMEGRPAHSTFTLGPPRPTVQHTQMPTAAPGQAQVGPLGTRPSTPKSTPRRSPFPPPTSSQSLRGQRVSQCPACDPQHPGPWSSEDALHGQTRRSSRC